MAVDTFEALADLAVRGYRRAVVYELTLQYSGQMKTALSTVRSSAYHGVYR